MDPSQKASEGIGLSPEQLRAKLSRYVGSLPSTVIEELYQTLKPMSLPEAKVDEIIEKTLRSYSGQESDSRMNELVDKMSNLEETLIHALKAIESKQERLKFETEQVLSERADANEKYPPPVMQRPEPEPVSDEPDTTPVTNSRPIRPFSERSIPVFSSESQRILLPDVPEDAISNAILLKWVEFLLETVGHQNLPEVLDYYVDIGWISEKVTMKLLAYSSGMVAPRGRSKEKLSTKDHLRSLLFIEKLRGKDFDQSQLTRLEREIKYTIEKRIREG